MFAIQILFFHSILVSRYMWSHEYFLSSQPFFKRVSLLLFCNLISYPGYKRACNFLIVENQFPFMHLKTSSVNKTAEALNDHLPHLLSAQNTALCKQNCLRLDLMDHIVLNFIKLPHFSDSRTPAGLIPEKSFGKRLCEEQWNWADKKKRSEQYLMKETNIRSFYILDVYRNVAMSEGQQIGFK